MTDRELMQQALEALEWASDRIEPQKEPVCDCPICKASDALRERLAQSETGREWVGLTDEEIALICGECAASAHRADDISYARAIEAKLKEKNQ